jgi:hypothetical protein
MRIPNGHAIVSLVGRQAYDPSPLDSCAWELQDLAGGVAPADPAGEERVLRQVVSKITSLLGQGIGVVVHCQMGIGRTGIAIGSVLVAGGHDPSGVATWLDAIQRQRGAKGWPESPWQRDMLGFFAAGSSRLLCGPGR